jgi:hypothetical protein
MTAAYDAVVERLRLKPDDPRTGKLAVIIVQLVKAGGNAERLLVGITLNCCTRANKNGRWTSPSLI